MKKERLHAELAETPKKEKKKIAYLLCLSSLKQICMLQLFQKPRDKCLILFISNSFLPFRSCLFLVSYPLINV